MEDCHPVGSGGANGGVSLQMHRWIKVVLGEVFNSTRCYHVCVSLKALAQHTFQGPPHSLPRATSVMFRTSPTLG